MAAPSPGSSGMSQMYCMSIHDRQDGRMGWMGEVGIDPRSCPIRRSSPIYHRIKFISSMLTVSLLR